jgi:hypothetical protein
MPNSVRLVLTLSSASAPARLRLFVVRAGTSGDAKLRDDGGDQEPAGGGAAQGAEEEASHTGTGAGGHGHQVGDTHTA